VDSTKALHRREKLLKFESFPFKEWQAVTEYATQWSLRPMADDPGLAIAVVAGIITALLLLAAFSLIIAEARKGNRTIEDSEAAVRHFLPF
jgi:nitric oxide reductase large subunit